MHERRQHDCCKQHNVLIERTNEFDQAKLKELCDVFCIFSLQSKCSTRENTREATRCEKHVMNWTAAIFRIYSSWLYCIYVNKISIINDLQPFGPKFSYTVLRAGYTTNNGWRIEELVKIRGGHRASLTKTLGSLRM